MTNTQLPAHLLALFSSNPELASVGANIHNEAHPKIRYNGKKWRLIPASGEEQLIAPQWVFDENGKPVGTSPVNALDVIIVDINEHKSHVVYPRAFDADAEAEAPVWSSHDGTPVPPEHENKVVSDYRHVAVLVANDPTGIVYELRISAGSITNFDRYNTAIKNFGLPIGAMVTRITFDDTKDHPKLVFAPASYLTPEQAALLGKVSTESRNQIKLALGQGRQNQRAIAAPAPQAVLAAPANYTTAETPMPASAAQIPVESKKPRKVKQEVPPTVTAAPAVSTNSAPAGIVLPMQPSAPTEAAKVVTKPAAAGSDLDALLNNIMGAGR